MPPLGLCAKRTVPIALPVITGVAAKQSARDASERRRGRVRFGRAGRRLLFRGRGLELRTAFADDQFIHR
jgi:hypothetical protein